MFKDFFAASRRQSASRFALDERGNIAVMFGLSLLPMMVFVGASVDYTRATVERTKLQAAVDAAALSLAQEPSGTPLATLQSKGQLVFNANFSPEGGGAAPLISVTPGVKKVRVSAQADVPAAFIQLAGISSISVATSSEVAFGTRNIELALVLDNTGSMGQNGKIQALKASVNSLLTKLQQTSQTPGDIKVSIVPFNTQVKIATSYSAASWLRYDVTLENVNWPLAKRLPVLPAAWTGCLSDRDQLFDASSAPSSGGASRYVASSCTFDSAFNQLAPVGLLTQDLETVRTKANAMVPTGSTNVTNGFVSGLATLRSDNPLGAGASTSSSTAKFLVLLTDGNNTANRFGGNGADFNAYAPSIDARLSQACQDAKTAAATKDVQVFTIRVMDGNAALLQSCASNPGMYYDVQNAGQLQGVFDQITRAITSIRITS